MKLEEEVKSEILPNEAPGATMSIKRAPMLGDMMFKLTSENSPQESPTIIRTSPKGFAYHKVA